jgi:hypothetical protein
MPVKINIEKTYYILNQKTGHALEFAEEYSELQLNSLDTENPNQIWILKSHPSGRDCYYIIHGETDNALELTENTSHIEEFGFQEIDISDFIEGNPNQSWFFEATSEKTYAVKTQMGKNEYNYLGLPKSNNKKLPSVLVSSSENTYHDWVLKEAPERTKASLFEILLSTPSHMIREMCKGIADAQRELDAAFLDTQANLKEKYPELFEIGYQVTWYHIPEASMELKVAVHFERNEEGSRILVSPYNASYKSQFKFTADGSSNIKLRVVPIPPPIGLGEKK